MRYPWIQQLARVVIFGGWVVPLLLAQAIPAEAAPEVREAAGIFNIIGGSWAFLAVVYAAVLAVRVRRRMLD